VPVALVTGANSGIGYAIAERLLRDGFDLGYATHDRGDDDRESFDRLCALGRVHWVDGDLGDASTPRRLVGETASALGPLDVLVNNAGLSTSGLALELTVEDFDRTFAVDVRAAFLLSQEAARSMGERGGTIVNITSIHEHVPRVGFSVYAAAKAALGMLTRGFALELAAVGIRVNAVAPGLIASERNAEAAEDRRLVEQHHVVDVALGHGQGPLARERRPEAVGHADGLDRDHFALRQGQREGV